MTNLAALTPFRRLAAVAPFTRNVDALFKDFFLGPLSLDGTAPRHPAPDADITDDPAGQEPPARQQITPPDAATATGDR